MSFFNRMFRGTGSGELPPGTTEEELAEGTYPGISAEAAQPAVEAEAATATAPALPAPKLAPSEPIIVDALLRQVEGATFVVRKRLHEAGFQRFTDLSQALPHEVAGRAEVSAECAAAIVERFQRYAAENTHPLSSTNAVADLKELSKVAKKWREQEALYEGAAAGWSRELLTEKRRLRSIREQLLQHVRVCLARLGELEFLSSLEKMSPRTGLAALIQFLQARAKSRAAETSSREAQQQ